MEEDDISDFLNNMNRISDHFTKRPYNKTYIIWDDEYDELNRALSGTYHGLSKLDHNISYNDHSKNPEDEPDRRDKNFRSPLNNNITLTDNINQNNWGFIASRIGNSVILQLKETISIDIPIDISTSYIRLEEIEPIFRPSNEIRSIIIAYGTEYYIFCNMIVKTSGMIEITNVINVSFKQGDRIRIYPTTISYHANNIS